MLYGNVRGLPHLFLCVDPDYPEQKTSYHVQNYKNHSLPNFPASDEGEVIFTFRGG